jgi:oligopeptide/dipeptide ABC transporter ATP-binding protein
MPALGVIGKVDSDATGDGGGRDDTGEREVVLSVRDLRTHFFTDQGIVRAVDGVSLHVKVGETVALVGESGSGKTVTALSILRLVRPPARIVSGSVIFAGQDLLGLPPGAMRRIRGREIALIFQEPMSSLNPAFTIGWQISEALKLHRGMDRRRARAHAADVLDLVRIPEARKRLGQYPHELSGGMKQRVMIAMALCCRPRLLIADEPTASLDVTIQAQILELIKQLKEEVGTTLLLITHSLGVVAEMADRVAVMYAGQVVEVGSLDEIFTDPVHPYTAGLLASISGLEGGEPTLRVIPGDPPDLLNPPLGCRFRPRCEAYTEDCREDPPEMVSLGGGRWVRCWRRSR